MQVGQGTTSPCPGPSMASGSTTLWPLSLVSRLGMQSWPQWVRGILPFPLTSHPRSPSGPTDAPAHFLRSFPEPFSLLLSVPKSVSLFPPAFLAGLASLQLPGYLPVPVFGVGRFSRQAHHSRQEYDSWGSFSSSQMRPRRPGELAPRNALSKPPNLHPPAARGRARGAKRAKGNNPGSPSDPTYTTFWLSAAPAQPLSLPSLPAVLYFPLFTSRLTHLSPGPWNHTPLHF